MRTATVISLLLCSCAPDPEASTEASQRSDLCAEIRTHACSRELENVAAPELLTATLDRIPRLAPAVASLASVPPPEKRAVFQRALGTSCADLDTLWDERRLSCE